MTKPALKFFILFFSLVGLCFALAPYANQLPLARYNVLPLTFKSPAQEKIIAHRPADYPGFFNSEKLPEVEKLSAYYFLEDLHLPENALSESNSSRTKARLRQIFSHYVYGYAPEIPLIETEILSKKNLQLRQGLNSEVTDMLIHLRLPQSQMGSIRLILFRPVPSEDRIAPIIVASNPCGNHLLARTGLVEKVEPAFEHKKCRDKEFLQTHTDRFWSVDYLVERGYGLASFHDAEVAPDDEKLFRSALMSSYTDPQLTGKNSWGAVAAWAWGLRIAGHALLQAGLAERGKISVFGHSRRGKAALWAAANDDIFSSVLAHQSGTLGTALARNHLAVSRDFYKKSAPFEWFPRLGSQEESLAVNYFLFPHWFTPALKEFHRREERLPVDQHLLFALLAPRTVIDSQGLRDRWSNFDSSLQTIRQSQIFYEQLSAASDADKLTAVQFRLDEKHLMTVDYWREILSLLPR